MPADVFSYYYKVFLFKTNQMLVGKRHYVTLGIVSKFRY